MLVPKDDPFGMRPQYRAMRYRTTLNELLTEHQQVLTRLQEIEQEKGDLEQRLVWLTGTIEGLKPLCQAEIEEEDAPKLGALCYHTLLNLPQPVTAPELRLLIAQHMDLSRYPNPLAMIHMTLKRMPDKVQCFNSSDGKTYYQPAPPPGLGTY